MNTSSKIIAATLVIAAAPWFDSTASALPISSPLALHNALAPGFEAVGYRSRGYVGAGIGLAAGAIIGGAILNATQPHGYYGYDGGYGYGTYGYGGYSPPHVQDPGYLSPPPPGPP